MTKGPHSHPAHRNPQQSEAQALAADNAKLVSALRDCVVELDQFKDDASCDHSVGICWCSYHLAIDQAKTILSAHDRSARFIKDLDAS